MSKNQSVRRLWNTGFTIGLLRKQDYQRFLFGILSRRQSQWPSQKPENGTGERKHGGLNDSKQGSQLPLKTNVNKDYVPTRYSSDEDDFIGNSSSDDNSNKWKLELDWLTKPLEPALQLCKWALPSGTGIGDRPPPTTRSISEIFASIQRSKIGLQDWSLSDLTVGLYLIYLQQASKGLVENVKGEQIFSESTVHDLIYHMELAKGAYKDNPRILAKISMLRESNVVKFVNNSSVLRPGYYVGIDERRKNVVLGIRGTHTLYDLVTDIVSSSHEELTFEGYSTHYGTAEAARWFLQHEIETIKMCLNRHQGFRLRIVGHSLGGAIASLLAIMLRKRSMKELGFDPQIVSAVGFASPPCVSRELAESCSDYVSTVVMQDDIIPRLSVGTLTRLRNEIIQTDWVTVLEKEDWKRVVGLVTNAKQVVSSVQDVTRKLADYAKLKGPTTFDGIFYSLSLSVASNVRSLINVNVLLIMMAMFTQRCA
ncbi:OLC1v1007083C1 [Oldenlandia corymbosa var. corymbosa]|uniref:OLC1v1007083C1 n=1 Tax=Oldenlandia corymbosa var. corymbosa TaxID=529605 RepID=A0AAV1DKW1_OLDCO|nr:OLC1v1007083C1 [Oldenlandia corymbosa var. corymbosa]